MKYNNEDKKQDNRKAKINLKNENNFTSVGLFFQEYRLV